LVLEVHLDDLVERWRDSSVQLRARSRKIWKFSFAFRSKRSSSGVIS